jgi:hypothetical protein
MYDKHVTGMDYEEVWKLSDGSVVCVDGRSGNILVEAKWTGNPKQWDSSPYNPSHEFHTPEIDAKVVDQARRLLQLQSEGGFKALNYTISNAQGRAHFLDLLSRHFPDEFRSGRIKVWEVDGTGMSK